MSTEIKKASGKVATPPVVQPLPPTETALAPADQSKIGLDTAGGFALAQRVARMFATSTLVPEVYRGAQGLSNCLIACEMAHRIGASPLMVMQNLYIVHGRPAWGAQFMISAFNACGRFAAIKFKFTGQKGSDTWGCIAFSTEKGTGEAIEGPEVTISMAKKEGWFGKNGSKWQTMPELMLRYRAAAFLVRTTAPELTMGILTRDEAIDIDPLDLPDNVIDSTATEAPEQVRSDEVLAQIEGSGEAKEEVKG